VGRHQRVLEAILLGRSDANVSFSDLCKLLVALGFVERVKGSHHVFVHTDVHEILTLQPDGAKAKAYQVKQVRQVLLRYRMGQDL
jgi:predicted RNA binding protein YcfA (HicA-like mRNA interferase family)